MDKLDQLLLSALVLQRWANQYLADGMDQYCAVASVSSKSVRQHPCIAQVTSYAFPQADLLTAFGKRLHDRSQT